MIPGGFIELTNVHAAYGKLRVAVRAIASYQRRQGAPHTVVTLLTTDETQSDVYHVTETQEEIDARICATMVPHGLPDDPRAAMPQQEFTKAGTF